ncbi:MAG: YfhO family protein [Anaerolineae bacterium]|nr:YfhO family protein [Anaerolineae bacterium]
MSTSHPLRAIRHASPELIAIAILWALYISLFAPASPFVTPDGLDTEPLRHVLFDPDMRQSGLEHERLVGAILPIKIGLERYGHIPTWNPYLGTGVPIINNGFNYLFNPFHSLPVLLLGGVQGGKLSTFIALLIAGYSMWGLGRALGLGGVARVMTAVLYMANGGIAGKFATGHFQLAMSLAWPPLVLAAMWWVIHSPRRRAVIAFAVAFVLLFFAGNIYYVLHTLICCAVMVGAHLFKRDEGRWRIQWSLLKRVLIAGVFAFGLSALQFFPIWETRPYVSHDNQVINPDGSLGGNYSLGQAAANLIYPWPQWNTFQVLSYGQLIAVDYTYIGPTVFLFMVVALAVVSYQRLAISGQPSAVSQEPAVLSTQYFAIIPIALILALLMMIWAAGQTPILEWLYTRVKLLAEFRFLGRALTIAALWWIVLAGVAVDVLWKAARNYLGTSSLFDKDDRVRLIRALGLAVLVWGYLLLYSTANTSTRLGLVLNNFEWLNRLDGWRFTSFRAAADGLWLFMLVAVLFDTGLLIVIGRRRSGWRAVGTRILRIVVLVGVLGAVADVLRTNSQLYEFTPAPPDFAHVYPDVHQQSPGEPFPSINEPFGVLAFAAYENEVRNWGLTEGWKPLPLEGIIPLRAGGLVALPRWAVVAYSPTGDAAQAFAERFVNNLPYQQVRCYPQPPALQGVDPCDTAAQPITILYQLRDPLPYAFIVPAERLLTDARSLNGTNVFPARVLEHQQDVITLQAITPGDGLDYYLIVQETNFPGWQALVDGVPVQPVTAETDYELDGYRGFVAVPIPAGTHTYTLRFVPPGLPTGILISGITLMVMGVYVGRKRKNA